MKYLLPIFAVLFLLVGYLPVSAEDSLIIQTINGEISINLSEIDNISFENINEFHIAYENLLVYSENQPHEFLLTELDSMTISRDYEFLRFYSLEDLISFEIISIDSIVFFRFSRI